MRCAITVALGVHLLASPAQAIDRVWDGGGGSNNTWSLPANWNPDGMPTAEDDLIIDVPGDFTVKCTGGVGRSLICNNKIHIQGGATLNILEQAHFGTGAQASDVLITHDSKLIMGGGGSIRSITLSRGFLVTHQVLSITEKLLWGWSVIEGGGKVVIEKDAVLEISNGITTRPLTATLDVYGETHWIEGNIRALENGYAINNFGNFIKSGPGTWGFASLSSGDEIKFNNHGSVEVQNGTLWCTAGTHTGSFMMNAGCNLHFYVHAVSIFEKGTSFTGAGNVTLECAFTLIKNSHFSVHAEIDLQGDLTVYRANCDFYGNVNVGGAITVGPGYTTFVGPTVAADRIVLVSSGLNLNNQATVVNKFELLNGILGLNGDLYVNETFTVGPGNNFSRKIMDGPGRIIIQPRATMSTIIASNIPIFKCVVENYGAVTVGRCEFENGTIINHGSMHIPHGWFEAIGGYGHIVNYGVLTHTQPEFFEYLNEFEGVHLTNYGTVDFKSGITALRAGVSNLGDIIIREGAECRIRGAYDFAPDSTTTGQGNIRLGGDGPGDLGLFQVTGQLYLEGDALGILNNQCSPSTVFLTQDSQLVINVDQQWNHISIASNAVLSGPGNLTLTAQGFFSGGVYGPGTMTFGPECVVQFAGGPLLTIARNTDNLGSITWASSNVKLDNCTFLNHNTIDFGRNGTSTQDVFSGANQSSFINHGVLRKVLTSSVVFDHGEGTLNILNSGIIEVISSKLTFGAGVEGPGNMHVVNGGRLEFTAGSEAHSISNQGVFAILNGAQILLHDGFVQSDSGQLEIALGAPGLTGMTCGEVAAIAGKVKATLSPLPPPYSSCTILQAPTVTGTFESACLAPNGIVTYKVNAVTFTTFAHGDSNGDGSVDADDLVEVINAWGSPSTSCAADLDGSGTVNIDDLMLVILNWD